MTLAPFLVQPLEIQLHLAGALVALVLGPFALWRRRRDRLHKILGYAWVSAMALAVASSLFIESHWSPIFFGPIHLLTLYAGYGLWEGMRAILRGDVPTHRATMQALYCRGLLIAGAFAFLPGRTMQELLLPEAPQAGYLLILFAVLVAVRPVPTPRPRGASGEIWQNGS